MHTTPDPNRLAQVKAAVLAALAQLPDDLQLWEDLLTVLRPWVQAPPPAPPDTTAEA